VLLSGGGPEDRTGVFALCIIRRPHDGKFVMTQEFAGGGGGDGGGAEQGQTVNVRSLLSLCNV